MTIVGIDEVGRGSWAGPLVAAAVILEAPIVGLKDSKLLTRRARKLLSVTIISQVKSYGIGWVSPAEIDNVGLTQAVTLAMSRAVGQINANYDKIIIDGSYNFLPAYPKTTPVIKADTKIPAVSAASIIAKVARDDYMVKCAFEFPNYFFDSHVGYGTKAHRQALQNYGPCRLHRMSYKPIAVHCS